MKLKYKEVCEVIESFKKLGFCTNIKEVNTRYFGSILSRNMDTLEITYSMGSVKVKGEIIEIFENNFDISKITSKKIIEKYFVEDEELLNSMKEDFLTKGLSTLIKGK
jgi:Mg2+/Co2+ transporter CorC